MNDVLRYKEYVSTINFNAKDEVFHGKVIGINDLVTFEGQSVASLKKAFKEAVEDYLETCRQLGKQPEKAYKGSFNVRVPVNLHREAALTATQKDITLNEFVKIAIAFALRHETQIDREMLRFG